MNNKLLILNWQGADQSFYTLDIADVLWKVQLWKTKMPNVKTYYGKSTIQSS